jgi:ATP-dependent DNA ligase
MTSLVPERSSLPYSVTLEGELVPLGDADGSPAFPPLCDPMLMRRPGISVTYMVFDLLSHDVTPNRSAVL